MNIPEDELPARALIFDRELIRIAYAARTRHGNAPHDEVWAGTLVLYPLPDNEHRRLCLDIALPLNHCAPGGVALGANVASDEVNWLHDFRCPDVAVYLATNPAIDGGTHWVGGPDVAVEVTSPGEDPRLKLGFYAQVNTRELLIVDRDPLSVALYQLQGGALVLVGTSDLATSVVLASGALPLTFQLQARAARPTILITHTATGQTWPA